MLVCDVGSRLVRMCALGSRRRLLWHTACHRQVGAPNADVHTDTRGRTIRSSSGVGGLRQSPQQHASASLGGAYARGSCGVCSICFGDTEGGRYAFDFEWARGGGWAPPLISSVLRPGLEASGKLGGEFGMSAPEHARSPSPTWRPPFALPSSAQKALLSAGAGAEQSHFGSMVLGGGVCLGLSRR